MDTKPKTPPANDSAIARRIRKAEAPPKPPPAPEGDEDLRYCVPTPTT